MGGIAERLGISEELVMMMSEALSRQGYLEEINPCESSCSGCHENAGCGLNKVGRMWLLTEKGQKSYQGE